MRACAYAYACVCVVRSTHLRSKSPIPLTRFWVYWIISENRNANAAAETSVVRVLFRFLSYMLGTGPPPTEVAIDERGASVSVLLLDAGRERRAASGGGVESEDRSPAAPAGNELVESTESRGCMACGVPGCGCIVSSRRLLCTPPLVPSGGDTSAYLVSGAYILK